LGPCPKGGSVVGPALGPRDPLVGGRGKGLEFEKSRFSLEN
jgi:hypothetical protein